jgi:hypothetical protein
VQHVVQPSHELGPSQHTPHQRTSLTLPPRYRGPSANQVLRFTTSEEYLRDRLEAQISWYDTKRRRHQAGHKCLGLLEIVGAASIASLFGHIEQDKALLVFVIGALVAVLAASLSLLPVRTALDRVSN